MTAGLSDVLREGHPHRWGLIKRQLLERLCVSQTALQPREEGLLS